MDADAFNVYLIDDDDSVLRSLSRLLISEGYQVSGFSSAEAFLAADISAARGCAVVDLGLPDRNGFAIQEALARDATPRPVIFLTGQGDIPASVRAMKAGAVDFLVKPVDAETLLSAIGQAQRADAANRQKLEERRSIEARLNLLTPRERQVLDGVVLGRLNKQIAGDLGTVEKTVKVHRGRMMTKMNARSVAELVKMLEVVRD